MPPKHMKRWGSSRKRMFNNGKTGPEIIDVPGADHTINNKELST